MLQKLYDMISTLFQRPSQAGLVTRKALRNRQLECRGSRVTGGGSQKVDGFSNKKRSNGSNTHPLKSGILITRAGFAEPDGSLV